MKDLIEIVEELTSLQGNVGYEDEVIRYIVDFASGLGYSCNVDKIGNVKIHITPENIGQKKLMFFAHSDEVGMMIRKIDDHGFIYCEKLGSLNPKCLAGLKMQIEIGEKKFNAVIGVKSHHLSGVESKAEGTKAQDYYLDVGAESKEQVLKAGIRVGARVSYKSQFVRLLNGLVANKSMDDRALIAILLYELQGLKKENISCDLYYVIGVQEEFNTRGIMPMARTIHPDLAVGLDVTPATDSPDLNGYSEIRVGHGPALTYMNHHSRGTLAGIVPNEKLLHYIEKLAEKNGFSIQREVATGILTETAYLAIENEDISVASISLPTRYTHTPVEVISLKDLEKVGVLITSLIYQYDSETDFGKNQDIKIRKEGEYD